MFLGKRKKLSGDAHSADYVEQSGSGKNDAPLPYREVGGSSQPQYRHHTVPVVICGRQYGCDASGHHNATAHGSAEISGRSGDLDESRSVEGEVECQLLPLVAMNIAKILFAGSVRWVKAIPSWKTRREQYTLPCWRCMETSRNSCAPSDGNRREVIPSCAMNQLRISSTIVTLCLEW